MENLEVRPKSFIIKWINAPDNSKIKWEVKPLKKSVNFGIYVSNSKFEIDLNQVHEFDRQRSNSVTTISSNSSLEERLGSRLTKVEWVGKCNGNELIQGTVNVETGHLYAFVFDNTFSKTTGKKILFNQYIEEERRQSTTESLPEQVASVPSNVKFELPKQTHGSGPGSSFLTVKGGKYLQGMLLKKKRKRSTKNFSQRFFVLNFKYGILNYYVNDRSNHVRGNMYIKNVIISADKPGLTIYLDSGLELWVLKAYNAEDWQVWIKAFNFIKKKNRAGYSVDEAGGVSGIDYDEEEVSEKIDSLKLTANKLMNGLEKRRPSFWRRYSRSSSNVNSNTVNNNSHSDDSSSVNGTLNTSPNGSDAVGLAKELYAGLLELETLVRSPKLSRTTTTAASLFSQEFYDAQEYLHEVSDKVVLLKGASEDGLHNNSSDNSNLNFDISSSSSSDADSFMPLKSPIKITSDDLYPLPLPPVARRKDISPSTVDPPSLIAFFRKNLGKDLSTIAMPVSSNEPLTFLQKYAESYEYTNLIDESLKSDVSSGERILKIAAFAISSLSAYRAKVRNQRKPFNPLLGETFELVREDLGFRLIAEKVEHRPFVIAARAESANWTIDHCPTPSQSIRGKTAEVTVKGTVTLTARSTGEVYQWVQPVTMLKNLIAGEKYSEPASSMTITCSNGQRAIVNFKVSGMFSGRSETLSVRVQDKGQYLPLELRGSWTEELHFYTEETQGELVWKAGNLVPNYASKFGFTEFAAGLNQITMLEKGKLAPTDSRLRPDQNAYENGDVDEAEQLKLSLEEAQRLRRKENEATFKKHETKFFKEIPGSRDPGNDDKPLWAFVEGDKSYWNRRKRQDWGDLLKLW
ncbi:unnamed protein product [Kuraishia capsulata CBS 1993]|uniref:PH domain-containing protein n=1 Tax=Kuraishia capsulata CBS 1993 TaxID=1382522 RepID=W6MJB0_9ASCO|nr:uncharacterized protein KUCA_T00000460001 [Kuraishia capsulata CBS 1993]CDK24497.1 unnamed protein product [Kuraishia capsulata CBS 1993]